MEKGFRKGFQNEDAFSPWPMKLKARRPKIIMITAVPLPLRVMVENMKARLPKNNIGKINWAAISKGFTG